MVAQNAQERLLHLADVLEGSRRVFQQKIGKSCSYIVNVTTPSRKALRDIKAAYPQVNTDWIITGEGEMFIEGASFTTNNTWRKAKNNNEGTAEHVGDNIDTSAIEIVKAQNEIMNKLLEQNAKKDEQIDRLLTLQEKSKNGND